ncbi:hypothetical protein KKE74_02000 [Patescibacteria group bacterium]|nr:hypothetical protein [Patescibacteria group bacterium]
MIEEVLQVTQTGELPFVLTLLEDYPGAIGPTTSGTYDDIDCADRD